MFIDYSLFQFQIILCSLKSPLWVENMENLCYFSPQLFLSGLDAYTLTIVGATPQITIFPTTSFFPDCPSHLALESVSYPLRLLRLTIVYVILGVCFVLFLIFEYFSVEFRISMRMIKGQFDHRVKYPPNFHSV